MKKHDFSYAGGFPMTQDRLKWMQEGWEEGFHALCMMLGEANLQKGVILQGMDYSYDAGPEEATITAGWFATKEVGGNAVLCRVAAATFVCPVATNIPLVVVGDITTPLTFYDASTPNAIRDHIGATLAGGTSFVAVPGYQLRYPDMIRYNEEWIEPTWSGTLSADATSPIRYRKQGAGKTVEIQGISADSLPSSVSSDTVLFILPAGYRPGQPLLFTTISEVTPTICVLRIKTNGEVSIAGDIVTVSTDEFWVNASFGVD